MEPDTGQIMIEAFHDTPGEMGIEPTGTDPGKVPGHS